MPHSDAMNIFQAEEEFNAGNFEAALRILGPLSESGNARAQCYLASAYQCGLGVKADGKIAVDLYVRVANQKITEGKLSAIAYNNLATLYRAGAPGVMPDTALAEKYSLAAKSLGFDM